MKSPSLLIIIFSALIVIGCTHKPLAVSDIQYKDQRKYNNKEKSLTQDVQYSEEIENEYFDEELDFLEEEEEEEESEILNVSDPLVFWNRAMFHFNDKFYFWILKPSAKAYKFIIPKVVRTGVQNFFRNLTTPIRLANCLLQHKGSAAVTEFYRFIVNSTAGVLGFGDPAKTYCKLNYTDEDLGQSLAVYGIGNGFYIVWPFLGPSTLRDSAGIVGDWFLNPVSYVNPTKLSMGITAYKTVNETSFRLGDYESFKEAAFEPYEAFRDAYIQLRLEKVKK